MKRIFLMIGLCCFFALPSHAQNTNIPNMSVSLFPGVPSGSCGLRQYAQDQANGNFYNCLSGSWNELSSGSGVTSITISGTSNQVTVTGTCTVTSTGTCTLSLPAAIHLGTDNSTAGTVQFANGSANAHTIFGSAATTSNTILGFSTAPTTTDLIECVTSSTTCTLTDSGIAAASLTPISGLTTGYVPQAASSTSLTNSACDHGITTANTFTCTDTGGFNASGGPIVSGTAPSGAAGSGGFACTEAASTGWTPTSGTDYIRCDSTLHAFVGSDNGASESKVPIGPQYTKGSCTELWGGSGTSFALTSGDDAIVDNACYNDSGVTRTITAVKCRSDNSSNTTTVNPTFGSAGTGTTILSGALTCGNSLAYSSSGTVSNASWTTGSGITPAMGGTLTGTSIAMIVEYTF